MQVIICKEGITEKPFPFQANEGVVFCRGAFIRVQFCDRDLGETKVCLYHYVKRLIVIQKKGLDVTLAYDILLAASFGEVQLWGVIIALRTLSCRHLFPLKYLMGAKVSCCNNGPLQ